MTSSIAGQTVQSNNCSAPHAMFQDINSSPEDLQPLVEDPADAQVVVSHTLQEEVQCSGSISADSIKAYMTRAEDISDYESSLLQFAMAEVESVWPQSAMRNAHLKIMSGNPSGHNPVFVCGKPTNRFLVVGYKDTRPPEFVVRESRSVETYAYLSQVRWREWANIVRIVVTAVISLSIILWVFANLHIRIPLQGCVDLKVKLYDSLNPFSPPPDKNMCLAPSNKQSFYQSTLLPDIS